jgi:hypothetical protein
VSASAPPRVTDSHQVSTTGRRSRPALADSAPVPAPAPPPPTSRRKPKPKGPRWDAAAVLSIYALLIMLMPATETVANLGALGSPATMYSVLALLWFLAGRMTGHLRLDPGSSSVRKAMCVLFAVVAVSYVGVSGRVASGAEIQAADRALIICLVWCGLVAVASAGITERNRLDALLRRLVIFGTIVAAMGIVEFFTGFRVTEHIVLPGLPTNIMPGSPSTCRSRSSRPATRRVAVPAGAARSAATPRCPS